MADIDLAHLDTGRNAIRQLRAALGTIPPELQKRLRPAMTAAARPILADAQARARRWSTRVPRSLRISTSFTRRRAGVSIVARSAVAPHARAYEGIKGNTTYRHRVYGHDRWVTAATRPSIYPAVELYGREVLDAVNRTVDRTVTEMKIEGSS